MSPSAGASSDRLRRLRLALAGLAPAQLDIEDQSHLHAGHAGAEGGRGHFYVRVVSERFHGLPTLARHRAVYAALGDLMQTDVHALSLETLTPAEAAQPPART
jgi:BolA protein